MEVRPVVLHVNLWSIEQQFQYLRYKAAVNDVITGGKVPFKLYLGT